MAQPQADEHRGYFTVEIEPRELEKVRQVLKWGHGVHMQKSNENPYDNWWFFLMPQGTTKVKTEQRGEEARYTICLPDNYCFTLEVGPMNRDRFFVKPPKIYLNEPGLNV